LFARALAVVEPGLAGLRRAELRRPLWIVAIAEERFAAVGILQFEATRLEPMFGANLVFALDRAMVSQVLALDLAFLVTFAGALAIRGAIQPAQLLLLNPLGVTITEMAS
jgi:hypothetical protein